MLTSVRLAGSARVAQEAKDASQGLLARQEIETKQNTLERKRKAIEAQMDVLRLELETEEQESKRLIVQEQIKLKKWEEDQREMAKSRSLNEGTRAGNAKGAGARRDRR
jgi:circadian clock protein KaiC